MVIRESDRRIARGSFRVAVGMIMSRDPDTAELAQVALDHPTPITTRALLNAGEGRAWQPMLLQALAEAGIAASEDILGGDDAE